METVCRFFEVALWGGWVSSRRMGEDKAFDGEASKPQRMSRHLVLYMAQHPPVAVLTFDICLLFPFHTRSLVIDCVSYSGYR
jgi:hypothetical protein